MKKNILIIDDSALMRRVISDIINSDDRFIVADLAINGLEGFELLINNIGKYDVILLDINMPKLNGIELLERLVQHHIEAKVILVSTLAKEGAKETIQALELGAFDFVTKPDSFIEAKSDTFKNNIIQSLLVATNQFPNNELNSLLKKKEMEKKIQSTKTHKAAIESKKVITGNIKSKALIKSGNFKLIALACSTGGPKALQVVIPKIPANIDASMLIVQHMPEGFTNTLANRLNELSQVTVKEAVNDEIIQKGVVYLAKGGSQMTLIRLPNGEHKLSVVVDNGKNILKPCADIMYESLLDSTFDEITCVVLTGMGSDGTKGIKQLQEKKKIQVIAQNEETCTVYGMPKVVIETGLVNEVVSLSDVAEAITRSVGVH